MAGDGIHSALGIAPAPDSGSTSPLSEKAMLRYQDAYRTANFINGVGRVIKIIGFVVGACIFLIGLLAGSEGPFGRSDFAVIAALICAAITCLVFFVAGVMVSAQGQHLKASLDCAVHSSPFMDDSAKARAMSL